MPDAAASACVLQLTDLHLYAEPGTALLGLDTRRSFEAVLARATADFPAADLCLLSGDLSEDGSAAAYRYLAERMAGQPWPSRWLPGNHDDGSTLAAALAGRPEGERQLRVGTWQLLLLDSSVPGQAGGALGAAQRAWLAEALVAAGTAPVLVALHHHPVPCGTAWIDAQCIADAEAFWTLLAGHPQVRAVLCGHIHQAFDRLHRGVRVLASPSTCLQFEPGSPTFRLATSGPGYRWLRLHADGGLDTGVVCLPAAGFAADYANREGY